MSIIIVQLFYACTVGPLATNPSAKGPDEGYRARRTKDRQAIRQCPGPDDRCPSGNARICPALGLGGSILSTYQAARCEAPKEGLQGYGTVSQLLCITRR
jgi:hypothetical protein